MWFTPKNFGTEEHKKHSHCFNCDSAVDFEFEGIEANTIILFFSVKN